MSLILSSEQEHLAGNKGKKQIIKKHPAKEKEDVVLDYESSESSVDSEDAAEDDDDDDEEQDDGDTINNIYRALRCMTQTFAAGHEKTQTKSQGVAEALGIQDPKAPWKNCRNHLLSAFKSDEMALLRASGTEEEYCVNLILNPIVAIATVLALDLN
ncbi:hypothetical protein BCR33DRAFT_789996 [Rhizoclosmatium globosum]|uniref:Uncharacterized protein n=1 Tax=Rhizoclosmatium globosum TaxID=329046 RepID=A0A1Y2BQ10_9FUNG|nr:hypothetical protein BCR33DRAFT_789996 [Rhizoclosmatium globosum]|eukprot:ORY36829.1 hypothetical protein BCR33DRAFT_789996 [Rhizoclosmatium globosum]